jgi:hypothetical protein
VTHCYMYWSEKKSSMKYYSFMVKSGACASKLDGLRKLDLLKQFSKLIFWNSW